MQKKTARLLAVFLAAMLVIATAACGKTEENNLSKNQRTEESKNSTEAVSKEEPVTLTMFIRNQSKYTGFQEDPVADYIEEHLGIKLELTVDSSLGSTSAQTSTFNELLASKLASNDLDDIMDFGSTTGNPEIFNNLQRVVEAEMIVPLDDLVEEYAPNLATDSRLKVRNEFRRDHLYNDGKFYTLGGWGGVGLDQLPGAAPWIRWDLYKDMGYPEVNSDMELLDLLEEMMAKYPETPSGEKTYGIGGAFADPQGMGDGFVNRDYPLGKGYEPLEGNYAAYINHATQQVETPLLDPDSFFWNGVKFYFEANQRGLLDPSAMVNGASEYGEKTNKGIYLATFNGWGVMNKEELFESIGIENSGYMPMKPFDDVVSLPMHWESVMGGNEFAITRECKQPEKAIAFLDWCFSEDGARIITQGAQGLAWDLVDGVPTLTDQFIEDNNAGTVDMSEVYGKWKYAGINSFQHIDMHSDGYYIQPEQIPNVEGYSPVKKDALAYYGTDSFTDYFTNYKDSSGNVLPSTIWSSFTTAIGSKPNDIKHAYGQINEHMYKAIFKMVYADTPAEYETLKQQTMDELEGLGLAEVEQWYVNRFKEIHSDLDTLVDEAIAAYQQ